MEAAERLGTSSPWERARRDRLRPEGLLRAFEVMAPPVPVELLARKMGVEVHRVRQPGWDGALSIENNKAHIWVDGGVSPHRQRFTIAHEIGHLMLHDGVGRDGKVLFRDRITMLGVDPVEREANQFAAELLMPEWMLRSFLSGRTVEQMAELFDVSPQAMTIRLQSLRRGGSFG